MGRIVVIIVAGLMVAPGPKPDADSLTNSAKQAYERGDGPTAIRLLDQAVATTDDPGLIAFNRAVLQAASGEYRAAELDFIRCLADDACPIERHAKALLNRGICLVRHGSTAAQYRIAIESFQTALTTKLDDPAMEADLRHNLELAKLLWQQARVKEAKPPTPNDLPPDEPRRDPPMNRQPEPNEQEGNPNGTGAEPQLRNGIAKANGTAKPTDQTTPGTGTLAPLPDQERVERRTPEDTRTYLLRAANRLDSERRTNAELLAGPERKGVRDW